MNSIDNIVIENVDKKNNNLSENKNNKNEKLIQKEVLKKGLTYFYLIR